MAPVVRLVTSIDVVDGLSSDRQISISTRHEAELADGRRILLLDDRGWSGSGPADIWARTSVEELAATARTVVGPDEPSAGRTRADMAADHWSELAGTLARHGVTVHAALLEGLPHDVVLGDRLRERLTRARQR
jgi:hypothetical protein